MRLSTAELCNGIWPAHTTGLDPSRGLFSVPIVTAWPDELGGRAKHYEIKSMFSSRKGFVNVLFSPPFKLRDFAFESGISPEDSVSLVVGFIGHRLRNIESGYPRWLTQFADQGSQKAFFTALSRARHG